MTGQLRGKVWIFLPQASRESGVPASTLRRWCSKRRIRCRKVGKGRGHWQVLASAMRQIGRR